MNASGWKERHNGRTWDSQVRNRLTKDLVASGRSRRADDTVNPKSRSAVRPNPNGDRAVLPARNGMPFSLRASGTLIQFALLRDWFLYQPQVALSTGRRLSRFARLDDYEFRVSQPNPATCSHEGRSSWCRRRVLRPIAASTFKQVNLYPVST